MGMDMTLGYFYRLLVDQMPVCSKDNIRCFIMDDRGYLIAHQGLIEPNGRGPLEQQHLTRKVPPVTAFCQPMSSSNMLLSMCSLLEMLNMSKLDSAEGHINQLPIHNVARCSSLFGSAGLLGWVT